MSSHDTLTLSVAIVALLGAAASAVFATTHWSSGRAYLRILCGVGALGVGLAALLHLLGILDHGNQWFVGAVLLMLATGLAYDVVDW